MISDFVKGKKKFDYPRDIQSGIVLHRIIDTYTDEHPATREAKEYFRPDYRLYSGAIVDVVYDHFLAIDHDEFSGDRLFRFSQQIYSSLEEYRRWFPPPFEKMFPYMRDQNWLYNYRTMTGTASSLTGLVRRAAYLSDSTTAIYLFEKHYQPLSECFRQFWADAKPFVKRQFDNIKNGSE